MIKVEKLSYSFPDKDLYNEVSFSIEDGQHAVMIGSNGTGKTTLVNILMHTEDYLFDGKIKKADNLRLGYVSQFVKHDKEVQMTAFEYLCQDFLQLQKEQDAICAEMESAENYEEVYERYQKSLDLFDAVDGYNYETNIHKQLKLAGLTFLEEVPVDKISGGEYKLLQVIREMLMNPGLLIMDEPDVFLDFENLNGLRDLINSYKGTLLVITHNRYLLNHCFNKILHLENGDLQEFEGSYIEYNLSLLQMKIEMQEAAEKEAAWIEIQEKFVEKLRAEATRITNPAKGRLLKGRASYLERLKASRTREPFVDIRVPKLDWSKLGVGHDSGEAAGVAETGVDQTAAPVESQTTGEYPILQVQDYSLAFERPLLSDVSFEIGAKDKVALVGPNGTGKTTLLREIWKRSRGKNNNSAISIHSDARVGFLSQLYGDMLNEENNLIQEMEHYGFELPGDAAAYLADFCFPEESLKKKIAVLSGGEKNLLQLAEISRGDANFLILDEPTSHLDTWSQIALEKAIAQYPGAILMVSHDFYSIADCADYVLYVENNTIRKMSSRAFRKMIYRDHFDQKYLELEQQKKDLETRIQSLLAKKNYKEARKVWEQLEDTVIKMK